jgi:hypothetical protein
LVGGAWDHRAVCVCCSPYTMYDALRRRAKNGYIYIRRAQNGPSRRRPCRQNSPRLVNNKDRSGNDAKNAKSNPGPSNESVTHIAPTTLLILDR